MQFIKEKINKTFGSNYENHIYYIKMEPEESLIKNPDQILVEGKKTLPSLEF